MQNVLRIDAGAGILFLQTLFVQTKDPASLRAPEKKKQALPLYLRALISVLLSPCSPSTHH